MLNREKRIKFPLAHLPHCNDEVTSLFFVGKLLQALPGFTNKKK